MAISNTSTGIVESGFPPVHRDFTNGGCIDFLVCPEHKAQTRTRIMASIDAAQKTIHVGAYGYDDAEMHGKIVAAKKRGCYVLLVLDCVQEAGRGETPLIIDAVREGLDVYMGTSPEHRIRHTKDYVIDGIHCETGSLNYSMQAYQQNNSVEFVDDAEIGAWIIADLLENVEWLKANEPDKQAKLAAYLTSSVTAPATETTVTTVTTTVTTVPTAH